MYWSSSHGLGRGPAERRDGVGDCTSSPSSPSPTGGARRPRPARANGVRRLTPSRRRPSRRNGEPRSPACFGWSGAGRRVRRISLSLPRFAASGVSRSASLTARDARLVAAEHVRGAGRVGRLAALAGNLAELPSIHGGKAARSFWLRRVPARRAVVRQLRREHPAALGRQCLCGPRRPHWTHRIRMGFLSSRRSPGWCSTRAEGSGGPRSVAEPRRSAIDASTLRGNYIACSDDCRRVPATPTGPMADRDAGNASELPPRGPDCRAPREARRPLRMQCGGSRTPERLARQLVEEAAAAYRDIADVLKDQEDLVRRRVRLEPIAVLKG